MSTYTVWTTTKSNGNVVIIYFKSNQVRGLRNGQMHETTSACSATVLQSRT
jgi:hypothetical protein